MRYRVCMVLASVVMLLLGAMTSYIILIWAL
jgi:hypothetical protein